METLLPLATIAARRLIDRRETVAVAESSSGGLICAALLAVPGASAYFVGGGVIYTARARHRLLDIGKADVEGMRSASEPYALLLARTARDRLGTVWGLSETGAAGPSGNPYGDAAGHSCIALAGPIERARTVETGDPDRLRNMRAFSAAALRLLIDVLD
jgi:nicotinamide-nucleotide amidase